MTACISRRRRVTAAAGSALSGVVLMSATPAMADHHRPSAYTTNCPGAESLVAGTTWHAHRLAPGVTLREGRATDRSGYVDMHVLDVAVTNKHVRFAPLVRRVAERTPLSALAAGRAGIVAATNTGYFDFDAGTPLGPLMSKGQLLVGSTTKSTVVGFDAHRVVEAGQLGLSGLVSAGKSTMRLAGLNVVDPVIGLTAYTPAWGRAGIFLPRDAVSRYVVNGHLSTDAGYFDTPPTSGSLLVARGTAAVQWLSGLRTGTAVTVRSGVTSTTARPLVQAYAVGSQLVHKGAARTGMACRRNYPRPARTAIGFADKGQRLLIAVIADDPGTKMHGLDANQTARVMQDLGATEAYLLDGSGSTEMLARMPSTPTLLSRRNYPADGAERPMPVGLGVFTR